MVSLRCAVLLCCVLAVLINYSNQEGVKRRIHRKRGRQRTSAAPILSTAESQRQTNVARRNPNGVSASIRRQSSQSQSQSQSQSNTRQQQVRRRLPNNLLSPASSALSRSGGATRNNNLADDVISKPADRKIVCYYTNWSQYRPGVGKFLPENIDPLMCTHVIFAFSSMKNNRLVPFEHNDLTKDDKPGLYERVLSLKQRNPRLKVLLAVGGWTFGTAKFKQMTSNRYNRRTFVLGVAEYLRSLGFDGLDLDWEYPKGSQDKQNLAHLASELAEAFAEEASQSSSDRLLLTAAVPVGPDNIRGGYDVPSLARSLDFFNIMSYDYHGKWESQAGHNAPLNAPSSDSKWRQQLSVNASVALWMKLGVPANKIVLGMPTYGRSFTLSNPANSEVNAATSGGGKAGKYTKEAGFLAYYEICEMLRSGAVYRWHDEMSVPIMIDKSLWVGFDDERSIRFKMAFIRDRQLAGAMVWSIDMDDFTGGVCGGAKYPLITAMREELLGVPRDDNKADVDWSTVTSASSSSNTASQLTVLSAQPSLESFTTADLLALLKLKGSAVDVKVLEKLQAALARSSSSSLTPSLAASLPLAANTELNDNTAAPVVFCSVASWSSTRAGIGRFSPSKLPASLCTHIVWTFGRIINGRLSLPIGSDSTEASENQDNVADAASLQQSDYQQMIELRRQNPHLKLILSVGGWQAGPEPFQRLSQSNYRMDNFIYQTVDFLRSVKMDGLDIDWEYPSGPLERDAYSRLVREFRLAFDAEASAKKTSRLLLTISLPANEEAMRAGYDVREIAKHADFMNIMSFDFHGGWEPVVGHNAPLFALQKPPASLSQPYTQNVKAAVESWLAAGLPNHRTVLGVATYGRSFTLNNTAQYDIGAAVIGPGKQARYTREPGFISYYEICDFLSRDNTTLIWDSEQMVPFAINSDQWIGFDDERSLTSKVEWLREKQLAGALVWSADLDDFDGVACSVASSSAVDDATTSANYPLTRAVVEALDGYRTQRVYTGVGQETNANSASAADPNEVVCANSDGEVTFHRDSLDCKHYYLCQGTVRHHMPCPSNLVFNEQESVCDWPENVEACWAFTQAPPTS